MSEKEKPFSAPRWNEPIRAEVTGHIEFSDEEKKENKRKFREFLKKEGILKDEK